VLRSMDILYSNGYSLGLTVLLACGGADDGRMNAKSYSALGTRPA
jgi:hypothetical protein